LQVQDGSVPAENDDDRGDDDDHADAQDVGAALRYRKAWLALRSLGEPTKTLDPSTPTPVAPKYPRDDAGREMELAHVNAGHAV